MQAYCCYSGDGTEDGALLVFAESRNQARQIASGRHSPWDWEYIDVKAIRVPNYDHCEHCSKNGIVDFNEQLPAGVVPFYSEEEI